MISQVNIKGLNKLSGINIHSTTKIGILNVLKDNIEGCRDNLHIAITNTESMYYAKQLPSHLNYINSSSFSLCDGVGSVIAGKAQGLNIKRFNGPDFLLECCNYGQKQGWRHFFYGGKEGVADLLVDNLKKKFPEMKVAGTYCPPFRNLSKEEEKDVINIIKDSEADIIWVGLGLLKQEKWIAEFKNKMNVPWSVGVGAAFDFYAGTVKRAPKIFRETGFEWLYRLAREPRMFKRNVNSYMFMFSSIKDGIKQKFNKKK